MQAIAVRRPDVPRLSIARPQVGLVQTFSNNQLQAEKARLVLPPTIDQESEPITRLAGHIEKFWQAAQMAKQPIERKMLKALRQRLGQYEADELAAIREQGGSEIFMMLTSAKCRGAESWLREILLPETGRPWGLDPSPMPDLPPPVRFAIIQSVTEMALNAGWMPDDARVDMQLLKLKHMAMRRMKDIAKRIAERHELKIEDQFAEGGFEQALSDCIYDLVTFPAAIMKGPFLRRKKTRQWVAGPGGMWYPKVQETLVPTFERRSPFDIFPGPSVKDFTRGNFIDRYLLTRDEIQEMRGVPGYADDAIDGVISTYGDRGYNSRYMRDTERANLERREHQEYDPEGLIETLNFWGSVSGKMLLEWGYHYGVDVEASAGGPINATREYQIEAWKVGRYLIKAMVNPDPMGQRPYDKVSFEELPGSFWGQAIPELMEDSQRMCNGAARSVANNMAMSSGPMVEWNIDRLADGERVTQVYPWRNFQMTSDLTGNNQPAIRFFQPDSNVQELLQVYNQFDAQSDNITGFPKYAYGDSRVSGAGRTSSGLAQLLGNVGKGVKRIVAAMDRNLVRPKVARMFDHNMEHDPDPTIKGDLIPSARGTVALLVKEQSAMRQKEMLQATLNPMDMAIIGAHGRREMLRPALAAADFPADDILPDDLEMQLIAASLPPPHELLGKTGPNASATPGMGGGGGTPEGDANMDAAGNPPNGTEIREATQGYADGGQVEGFDPDGSGYDYEGARRAGLTPDASGHWPSRDPSTGTLLKGRRHPTFHKTERGEYDAGYAIRRRDGRDVSEPRDRPDGYAHGGVVRRRGVDESDYGV